ncbi:MAG: methyltransferase domain-containing protein [Pontixanthobacter sp.]
MNCTSPTTGRTLHHDTPHSLTDGQFERWPVVDGIPYLRTESEGLVALALTELDAGNEDAALVALLTDQDPWWTGPATDLAELRQLIAQRETLSLREAMGLLRYGPVADYFAHRWSDPTFLAGLAMIEAHWNAPATAFELAGGIGHYSRELARVGTHCVSGDIVFSKCWLAKHWVAPDCDYVVFDAKDDWPIGNTQFDLVHCQDAFYFLPDQARMAERLREATSKNGVLVAGHLHNADVEGGAFGPARSPSDWRKLFPEAVVYDERELRAALIETRAPAPTQWAHDTKIEAWSIVENGGPARIVDGGVAIPPQKAQLTANPLIGEAGPRWPSDRYAKEYGPSATWTRSDSPASPERDRRMVDLPERW